MSLLQIVSEIIRHAGYVLTVVYLVRLFLWRRYAQKRYWDKRLKLTLESVKQVSEKMGRPMPKFSILIPAMEEKEVIEKTVEHFMKLHYPKELCEIIIITDEKEILKYREKGSQPVITTQTIVDEKIKDISHHTKNIKHVLVPYDFDGAYKGKCAGHEVKSTKGRALNYGLQFVSEDIDIIGIYDADTRPDHDTLLYAVMDMAFNGNKIKIMQGPRIQTSNFSKLSPICRIYSLFQSMLHEWYFPAVYMKKLPFVGGTHLFIHRELVEKLKGFDPKAHTEDGVFGIRAYMEEGEWSYFLPCMSVEQTPPTFKGFFRQRVRWASGQFQIIAMLLKNRKNYDPKKLLKILTNVIVEGPVKNTGWQFFMIIWLLQFFSKQFRLVHAGKSEMQSYQGILSLLVFTLPYLLFYGLYVRYLSYSDVATHEPNFTGKIKRLSFLVMSIPACFLGIVPYLCAFILYVLNREIPWMKTVKTVE